MSMKNSNIIIGNRTCDLPTCSAVSQPTAPPRAPSWVEFFLNSVNYDYVSSVWLCIFSMIMYLQYDYVSSVWWFIFSMICIFSMIMYLQYDYVSSVWLCIFIVPTGTLRLPWRRFFRAFSSIVRQMPGYNSQRRGTARTLPKFLCCSVYCLWVNVHCTTATGWQPNCS